MTFVYFHWTIMKTNIIGIRGWSKTFKRGGGVYHECRRCKLSRGSGGMLSQKFLKIWISKMAISSILRQILYLFNTIFACKLCFCEKKKWARGRRGEAQAPPLGSTTVSITTMIIIIIIIIINNLLLLPEGPLLLEMQTWILKTYVKSWSH